MSRSPQEGDYVCVHYTGQTLDGHVFDDTHAKGPLTFVLGQGKVMRAFEDAVKHMYVGQTTRIKLAAAKAFGTHQAKLVQDVPRSAVEQKARVFIGNVIQLQIPYTAKSYPARIIAFDEQTVTLDLNSPLAGKDVTFTIELLSIERDGRPVT